VTKQRKRVEPGDIVAYARRPKRRGEVVAHNAVMHTSCMSYGANGFRWFCLKLGPGWKACPCGWRPDLAVHYALAKHVAWIRKIRKRLKSQAAFDRYVAKRVVFPFPIKFERTAGA
jgi:hypothetical protein